MKKRNSISFRVDILIVLAVVMIAGVLIASSYLTNAREVDTFYMEKTRQTAKTLGEFLDGDRLAELVGLLRGEEYQALREEAEAREDDAGIDRFLEEHGMLEFVDDMLATLSRYRDDQGATYVYLMDISAKKDDSMSLGDPDEPRWVLGQIRPDAADVDREEANEAIPPTVSNTGYGWLSSCYEPVLDSTGKIRVASVGVDIDMNEVMRARQAFLWQMLIYAAVAAAATVGVSVLLMRKNVIKPITMLSRAVDGFGGDEGRITREQVISLPINTKDEVGNLYQKTRKMEERLIDYMDNLASVTAEKERIGAELNIAAQIQADMLPRIFPAFPERTDIDIYASMDPAKEVGGDFYDFFLVDENHLCMVMADVSGKGVPAALFMVIAKTLIKNRALQGESPSEILQDVNNQLCDGNEAELFVTVWLGILDLRTGIGLAANAGHEHPVLRRAGGLYELVEYRHSPAVAVMEGMKFRQHEFRMNPGDRLFVYTDGVPEATNAQNELFGTERMLEALNRDPEADPEHVLQAVRKSVDDFVGDAPQFDDLTMLGLHYRGKDHGMKELKLEKAELSRLEDVLAMVEQLLDDCDCPRKTRAQVAVAVEEIYVNIAHYAYAPETGPAVIQAEVSGDPQVLTVTFTDRGVPYNPLEKPDPDVTLPAEQREIGGLGIYMVRKSMTNMRYEHRDGQNILTIEKVLA